MANMHLVTGYAGQEHVTAADQAAFHTLFIGGGEFVLDTGNQFAASIISNNQVRVFDGDIYMQGRFIRLDKDTSVDLVIENGAQGYSRHDLIVARYTENQATAIEEVNLVVIKGEPVAGDPVDPAYTTGDTLVAGDMLHDFPLYRVVIDGLNLVELVPLFQHDSDLQLIQKRTNLLPEGVSAADEDYFPVFDSSENKHKKMSWGNMRNHNHSADQIAKGILPVDRGGTGADNLDEFAKTVGGKVLSEINNLHVWSKYYKKIVPVPASKTGTKTTLQTKDQNGPTYYYSVEAEYVDGVVHLVNPKTIAAGVSSTTISDALQGMFFYTSKDATVRYYIKLYQAGTDGLIAYISEVTSGTDWVDTLEPVTALDRTAFQDNAEAGDGFKYVYQGKLVGGSRIALLEYIGTGTSPATEAEALTITAPFPVKFLWIFCTINYSLYDRAKNYPYIYLSPIYGTSFASPIYFEGAEGTISPSSVDAHSPNGFTWTRSEEGKTIGRFYHPDLENGGATSIFNTANTKYKVLVLG